MLDAAGVAAACRLPAGWRLAAAAAARRHLHDDRPLFWRMNHRGQRAMRDGDWKYLRVDGHDYLFNLEGDERERANLAPAPERLAAMRAGVGGVERHHAAHPGRCHGQPGLWGQGHAAALNAAVQPGAARRCAAAAGGRRAARRTAGALPQSAVRRRCSPWRWTMPGSTAWTRSATAPTTAASPSLPLLPDRRALALRVDARPGLRRAPGPGLAGPAAHRHIAAVQDQRLRDGMSAPAGLPAGSTQIVQDTGSGGSWPVSTDRVSWAFAAQSVLDQLDGDERQAFAAQALAALQGTVEADRLAAFDPGSGLYGGEQSFLGLARAELRTLDHRPPGAHGRRTGALDQRRPPPGLAAAGPAAGRTPVTRPGAARYQAWADALRTAIDRSFWLDDAQQYAASPATMPTRSPCTSSTCWARRWR
jgi:hypothetical protein